MLSDTLEVSPDQLVTSRFEACPAFSADQLESPVCAGCGWLEHEHMGSRRN